MSFNRNLMHGRHDPTMPAASSGPVEMIALVNPEERM